MMCAVADERRTNLSRCTPDSTYICYMPAVVHTDVCSLRITYLSLVTIYKSLSLDRINRFSSHLSCDYRIPAVECQKIGSVRTVTVCHFVRKVNLMHARDCLLTSAWEL